MECPGATSPADDGGNEAVGVCTGHSDAERSGRTLALASLIMVSKSWLDLGLLFADLGLGFAVMRDDVTLATASRARDIEFCTYNFFLCS